MTRIASLLAAVAVMATAAPALAQTAAAEARLDAAQRRFDSEVSLYRQAVDEYRNAVRRDGRGGYNDPRYNDPRYNDPRYNDPRYNDPRYSNYDWEGTYRPGGPTRVLTRDDTIYYAENGRAYCRRSDGTTGLVVGAALGGILGNVVDGGRQRTLGTLLGGAGGALLGRSIQQNQVRCE